MGAAGGGVAASSSPAASSSSSDPLAALRNNPQFNALRRLVQSNPQMLQTVLMQIGQEQPELLAAINSNQQAFLEMMNQPIEEGSDAGPSSSGSSSAGGPPPRATTIRLTEDERAAVERLISLGGFDPNMVVQAYLACDKNEELAANWLFDNYMSY